MIGEAKREASHPVRIRQTILWRLDASGLEEDDEALVVEGR